MNMDKDSIENIAIIKNDVKHIKKEVGDNKKELKDFIKIADKKYASKLTEKIVYGLVGIILLGVVGAIITGVVEAVEYVSNY